MAGSSHSGVDGGESAPSRLCSRAQANSAEDTTATDCTADTVTDTDTGIDIDTDPDTGIATNIVIGYHRLSPALPPTLSPTSLPTPTPTPKCSALPDAAEG